VRPGLIAAFLDWLGGLLLGRRPYEELSQECATQRLNGHYLAMTTAENERLREDNRERMVMVADLTRQLQAKIAVESLLHVTETATKPVRGRQLMSLIARDMESRLRSMNEALNIKPLSTPVDAQDEQVESARNAEYAGR